jgi:hypothetical protein
VVGGVVGPVEAVLEVAGCLVSHSEDGWEGDRKGGGEVAAALMHEKSRMGLGGCERRIRPTQLAEMRED